MHLSDLIGFHYQRYEPDQAAEDLIGKLEAIGRRSKPPSRKRPPLVSIILDGENCWEYYPDGGVEFLRSFYRRWPDHGQIKPVRVARLSGDASGHRDALGTLFAGSWISHNFAIWIGHPACNRAWDLLAETRAVLAKTAAARARLPAAESEAGLGRAVHRRRERLVLVVRRRPLQQPGLAVRPAVSQAPAKRLHAARAGAAAPSCSSRSAAPQRHERPFTRADRPG